ncbi:MAG: hypothetical protein WDO13_06575 [Verrucomicrobiota bacterium]
MISRVTHESSNRILAALESDELDIGVLLPPGRLSPRLRITHRFRDTFTFIANADRLAAAKVDPRKPKALGRMARIAALVSTSRLNADRASARRPGSGSRSSRSCRPWSWITSI